MMLRRLLVLPVLAFFLLTTSACDDGFSEINQDPKVANSLDPSLLFSNAVMQASGDRFEVWRAHVIYTEHFVQHLAANTQTFSGGDRYDFIPSWSSAQFAREYPGALKTLSETLRQLPSGPEAANKRAAANVLRMFLLHRLTDLYGDVPFSEANKALDGIGAPAYDPQEQIYPRLLDSLDTYAEQLDPSQPFFGDADLLFNGDVQKWQRWANSIMLRAAMRMSKVDPAAAEQWVNEAVNNPGGVMQSNDDMAYIVQKDDNTGPVRNGIWEVYDFENADFLSDPFVSFLKERNDPRLRVFGEVRSTGSIDPADQKGLPNGLDAGAQEGDLDSFTWPRRETVIRPDSPWILQTYAEVELLLAEAAVRGWTSGNAAAHYEAGVRAALTAPNIYEPPNPVTDAEAQSYLDENPFNTGGTQADKLRQINTQYWAATFLNGPEAFANWRRSGYPELEPVNHPDGDTGGTIPRRLTYPTDEQSTNADNWQAAIDRQGPDEFTTRVWWDVPQ